MKIAVDLDDVLGQTMPAIIEFHNKTYGTNFRIHDVKTYDLWDIWGGSKEEAIEKIAAFHTSPYGENIKPVSGALDGCVSLKKNNELFVITSRRNEFIPETERWIERCFPNMFAGIYFTNHFGQDAAKITKGEICDNLGIDVMIEDSLKFAIGCIAPDRKVFLFDQPWNQSDGLPEGITRVHSWKDIVEKIGKMR